MNICDSIRNKWLPAALVSAGVAVAAKEDAPPAVRAGAAAFSVLTTLVWWCHQRGPSQPFLMERLFNALDWGNEYRHLLAHLTDEDIRSESERLIYRLVCKKDFSSALIIMERAQKLNPPMHPRWGLYLNYFSGDAYGFENMNLQDSKLVFLTVDLIPPHWFFEESYGYPVIQMLLRKTRPSDQLAVAQKIYAKIPVETWQKKGIPQEIGKIHLARLGGNVPALEAAVKKLPPGYLKTNKRWFLGLAKEWGRCGMFSKKLALIMINVLEPDSADLFLVTDLIKASQADDKLDVLKAVAEKMSIENLKQIGLSLGLLARLADRSATKQELDLFIPTLDANSFNTRVGNFVPFDLVLEVACFLPDYDRILARWIKTFTPPQFEQLIESYNYYDRPSRYKPPIYLMAALLPRLDLFFALTEHLSAQEQQALKKDLLPSLQAAQLRKEAFSPDRYPIPLEPPETYAGHIEAIRKMLPGDVHAG